MDMLTWESLKLAEAKCVGHYDHRHIACLDELARAGLVRHVVARPNPAQRHAGGAWYEITGKGRVALQRMALNPTDGYAGLPMRAN